MLWLSVFWMLLLLSRLESFGILTLRLRSSSCLSVVSFKGFGLQWHNYLLSQAVRSVCLWYTALGSVSCLMPLFWEINITWTLSSLLDSPEILVKLWVTWKSYVSCCVCYRHHAFWVFFFFFFRTALSVWMFSRGPGHDLPQSLVKDLVKGGL